jgi:hypothetical protein
VNVVISIIRFNILDVAQCDSPQSTEGRKTFLNRLWRASRFLCIMTTRHPCRVDMSYLLSNFGNFATTRGAVVDDRKLQLCGYDVRRGDA